VAAEAGTSGGGLGAAEEGGRQGDEPEAAAAQAEAKEPPMRETGRDRERQRMPEEVGTTAGLHMGLQMVFFLFSLVMTIPLPFFSFLLSIYTYYSPPSKTPRRENSRLGARWRASA
jgi:hypothetical protein